MAVSREQGEYRDTMMYSRMEHVKRIRERIEREEYTVDPVAVAEAIVERLLQVQALREER
jgi:anti-sigma28 factor (negative regulator of flagellin synthesis)